MREFRAVRDDGDTRNGERDDARRRATCVAVRTCEPVVTLERSSRGLRRLVPRHSNAPSSRSDSKRKGEKQDGTRPSARRSTTRAALPEEAGQAEQEHERHDDIAPDGPRERVKTFHVPRRHGGSGCANLVVKFLDLTSLVFGFTVARERIFVEMTTRLESQLR